MDLPQVFPLMTISGQKNVSAKQGGVKSDRAGLKYDNFRIESDSQSPRFYYKQANGQSEHCQRQ